MNITAVIPARANSYRIPNKNMRYVGGKPLIMLAYESAIESKYITDIIVLIDPGLETEVRYLLDNRLLDDSLKRKPTSVYVEADPAPADSNLDRVVQKCLKDFNVDLDGYVVLLQPTSPLRTVTDIDQAIEKIWASKGDSLFSAYADRFLEWDYAVDANTKKGILLRPGYCIHHRPTGQRVPQYLIENGAIYITKAVSYQFEGARLGRTVDVFLMPKHRSIEIDKPEDLEIARVLYDYYDDRE
jgi:CMP-N,N'-diacetyllegionaminic acid synthase